MLKRWLIVPVFFTLFFLVACGDDTYKGDFEYTVDNFTAINQNGEEVSTDDFKGKFWIADFIFTNCPDVCPVLTTNMVRLQQMLKEEGLDVQLVSFSADPNVDKPEVLKKYAEERGAVFSNWDLLTGYSVQDIEEYAASSFKVLATKQNGQVIHQNYFHLVTPDGKHIKRYLGLQSSNLDKIIEDLKGYLD